MPFEFDYSINGRKVSKDQWLRHIADQAKNRTVDELKVRVERLRCAVHGRSPKIVKVTKLGDTVKFEIEACCDPMRKRAQQVAIGQ